MPQLNPAPWFTTLILLWLMMAILKSLLSKTQSISQPTELTSTHPVPHWPWMWH